MWSSDDQQAVLQMCCEVGVTRGLSRFSVAPGRTFTVFCSNALKCTYICLKNCFSTRVLKTITHTHTTNTHRKRGREKKCKRTRTSRRVETSTIAPPLFPPYFGAVNTVIKFLHRKDVHLEIHTRELERSSIFYFECKILHRRPKYVPAPRVAL